MYCSLPGLKVFVTHLKCRGAGSNESHFINVFMIFKDKFVLMSNLHTCTSKVHRQCFIHYFVFKVIKIPQLKENM